MHSTTHGARAKPLSLTPIAYAVSIALASIVAGHAAAQDAKPDAPAAQAPAPAPAATDIKTVVVQGQRAAQQSGIERKKNAATAMDSIVADDVGSFPDRNIG